MLKLNTMGKKITTFAGIKPGQKFKVIANAGGHCYPMDTVLTFKKPGVNTTMMSDCAMELLGNSLRASEVELCNLTIEDMLAEVKNLEQQIDDLNMKIAFCLESGIKEYDENTFKIMKALKVINAFSSDIEKAKELSKLLN
jgi:hypothetical protein